MINAAVIVLKNNKGEVLLLDRKSPPFGYGLPGGKAEHDEDMWETCLRELKEETGVSLKEDKFYIQQRKSELLGIISIRNQMCAEYNIAMSKFNYAFCNKGNLPQTNLEPLPREYKPYISNLK